MVSNLLNNSCKFTDKGGRIWLTVEQEGEHAVVRVRDTGLGIAADQLGRIFEMFAQVDTSLESARSGLGLGLTLVRNLVEMHGGTVEARSAGVGQGSEFVVRLPLLSVPLPARSREPAVEPTYINGRASDSGRGRQPGLGRHPCDAADTERPRRQTAHDGLEAIEAAALFQPDIILLDIGMPRLNGYEAARRIRAQQRNKSLTLVALTGWGQEEDRLRSRGAGFDSHLVKPVDLAALTKLLAESGPDSRSATAVAGPTTISCRRLSPAECVQERSSDGRRGITQGERRAWWQVYSERRFGILLVLLAVLLAGPPVLFGFGLSAVWFDALMALVVLAAIQSLCFERRQRLFALLLGIPTIAICLGGHALSGTASRSVLFVGHLCGVFFLFGSAGLIVKSLFNSRSLTFDSIYGAVCGYLFLGLAWAMSYSMIEAVQPGSFQISQSLRTAGEHPHRRC